MPTFTSTNSSVSALASEIIASALKEIGALAVGETADGDVEAWTLEKLQRLIDRINAKREMIYNVTFSLFALVTNTQPITIGPGGNFQMNQRPVRLVSAALVLTSSSSNIDIPIRVQDDKWWAGQQLKGLTSNLCTDVYYSPDNPLGNLNFWPIPTDANSVRLETWVGLTQAIDGTTALALPQAYWDFLVLALGRDLASQFGAPALEIVGSANFESRYKEAVKTVEGNNADPPRMIGDVPGGRRRGNSRPGFSFLTGQPW